jgi:hypothetical protein
VAAGPSQQTEANLELAGLLAGVCVEQLVDSGVGGQEGQTVSQFETFVTQRSFIAQGRPAQGSLVDQVQGQARGQRVVTEFSGPIAQQIPTAQAQVLGKQQPQSQEIARDLVGQELAHITLKTLRVDANLPLELAGALGG